MKEFQSFVTEKIRYTLESKRTESSCEEMAIDVNVIADYGVHKTTRKDTLEPSDTS